MSKDKQEVINGTVGEDAKETKQEKVEQKTETKSVTEKDLFKKFDTIMKGKSDVNNKQVISKDQDEENHKEQIEEEEKSETVESEEVAKEEEPEDEEIESYLVEAGRLSGLTDEEIVSLAENNPGVLERIAELQQKSGRTEEKKSEVEAPPKKDSLAEINFSDLEETLGEDTVNKVFKPLLQKIKQQDEVIENLKSGFGAIKTKAAEDRIEKETKVADDYFDKSGIPGLGKTSELPLRTIDGRQIYDSSDKRVKERESIMKTAMIFAESMPFNHAMREALVWYKGKKGDVDAENRLIKKINEQKKRFTMRPTGKQVHEDKGPPKTDADKKQQIESAVSEMLSKAGIGVD